MKYVVFLCDGMADLKLSEFGNKTPLEAAHTPNMTSYATRAILGTLKTVPDHLSPGSDVCNLSVMGYDSNLYYTGRSPLEAASIGVTLADNETSFRANLVTLSGEGEYEDLVMEDYSAGEIKTADAKKIIEDLASVLNDEETKIYAGVSYRHLLVLSDKEVKGNLIPPHDISKRFVKEFLPEDVTILSLMKKSYEFLKNHPYNLERIRNGQRPASSIWVWGAGKRPKMDSFYEKFGVKGSVISAVDLIKGIGILAGMKSIDVDGATGNLHTNFDGKAKAAANVLLKDNYDLVYVHLEAPDECGHQGDMEGKIKSLEIIDEKIIGYIKSELDKAGEDYCFMVLPDHFTPISIKTHSAENVPCVMYRKGDNNQTGYTYTEKCADAHGEYVAVGHELMQKFIDLGK